MQTCKYERDDYKCDYDCHATTNDGFCILHSPKVEKGEEAFARAVADHRQKIGDAFVGFVFPAYFSFTPPSFNESANFGDATFSGYANFWDATFGGDANFWGAAFGGYANFWGAAFVGRATFDYAKFKEGATFSESKFKEGATFNNAKFSDIASFIGCRFDQYVHFMQTKFSENAYFGGSNFSEQSIFLVAEFNGDANFPDTEFDEWADFSRARFRGDVDFGNAKFRGRADFRGAEFNSETVFIAAQFSGETYFRECRFRGPTLFASKKSGNEIIQSFSETQTGSEIDFSHVMIQPLEAISFRDVDLRRCRFRGTDLRKVEITNSIWRQMGDRLGVYDEYILYRDKTDDWAHVESLYRQLKQNYEDRRDYERARDFHYGEKEMRRKNPKTSPGLRVLLTLYWLLSGYGERYIRPILSLAVLVFLSMIGYLTFGLELKGKETRILDWTNLQNVAVGDFLQIAHYTFRVMTLLKPDNLAIPIGHSEVVFTIDSVLGPILIGLFALAVRQRLKR